MTAATVASASGFAALLAWVVALELAARAGAGAHATDALAAAMRRPVGRAAVLAGWVWLGVHFLAR